MKKQSKRATFEDVVISQDKLRKYLDDCVEKNIVLDKKERDKFIKLLRESTLGLGANHRFLYRGINGTYDVGHVEHAAMWLVYQDNNPVVIDGEKIEIKELWKELRDCLFIVFPFATTMSIKISQEQIKINKSEPADV